MRDGLSRRVRVGARSCGALRSSLPLPRRALLANFRQDRPAPNRGVDSRRQTKRPFSTSDAQIHLDADTARRLIMRARVTKDFTFEAAQTLPKAPEGHKCRRVHGHSFKVEVCIEGDVDSTVGWLYDHANISAAMKPLLKMLDHTYLNDIEGLENPTIENMAEWFWKKLEPQCPGLYEIVVPETPTARCIYRGQ